MTAKPVMLITGAAGFIGNVACQHFRDRFDVAGIDDLSRSTSSIPPDVDFIKGTVGGLAMSRAMSRLGPVDVVIHLAGQVSVVSSLEDPRYDLLRNTQAGLEAALWARECGVKCFIYANTNKVFGELRGRSVPVGDDQPLSPRTPYGISKAAAGFYIRDLLPDVSFDFRLSCIYGETQIGTEDQGWIGYLRRQIANGKPITCYGDGCQVRDLLHVDDLMRLFDLAISGGLESGSYTVGGGLENVVSFQEAVELMGGEIDYYAPARPHDQRHFISANEGVSRAGWLPTTKAREWLMCNGGRIRQPALTCV